VPTVRQVERRIRDREGFDVTFRSREDGRDVRDDRQLPGRHRYNYERMMPNSANVSRWIEVRFRAAYPDFDVHVLKADGTRAHGNYLLGNVLDTYLAE
jgi:hypothetical protein